MSQLRRRDGSRLLPQAICSKDRLTAMARVPTRSVRNLMAPRCSDPITKRRSRHTRLPQSDISGRGEPPVLLNWRDQFFYRHPGSWFFLKKPVKIGTGECCLKKWAKKGLQKFWCSCHIRRHNTQPGNSIVRWKYGIEFLLLSIIMVGLALSAWRYFDHRADREAVKRLTSLQPPRPANFDPAMIANLPEPVRRYFL
jgi:hypothetical protein